MSKYVYVVKHGQLSSVKNQYEFYGSEIFTSHDKAKQYVDNVIECNKGYARVNDFSYADMIPEDLRSRKDKLKHYQVDYKWRGENENGQVDVKSRIVVEQKVLNYGF